MDSIINRICVKWVPKHCIIILFIKTWNQLKYIFLRNQTCEFQNWSEKFYYNHWGEKKNLYSFNKSTNFQTQIIIAPVHLIMPIKICEEHFLFLWNICYNVFNNFNWAVTYIHWICKSLVKTYVLNSLTICSLATHF